MQGDSILVKVYILGEWVDWALTSFCRITRSYFYRSSKYD